MKDAGMRIRVEPDLRDRFVSACREKDVSAAQVLRAFMRNFVDQGARGDLQSDFFATARLNSSMRKHDSNEN